jgi:hypothetical protein
MSIKDSPASRRATASWRWWCVNFGLMLRGFYQYFALHHCDAAFLRSEYHQRIRLPLQRLPFSGMLHSSISLG